MGYIGTTTIRRLKRWDEGRWGKGNNPQYSRIYNKDLLAHLALSHLLSPLILASISSFLSGPGSAKGLGSKACIKRNLFKTLAPYHPQSPLSNSQNYSLPTHLSEKQAHIYIYIYMGGCQNYGPFWGTLNIRCRSIIGTQKGTTILTSTL